MAVMTQIATADGSFNVRVWSAGAGPPLLYLHGFEGHPGDAPFLHRLAQTHHVYAPELPGFGDSADGDRIDGVLDLVLFLRQLIEALGESRVDVAGHSLGGMFAGELAAIYPHLVRRLVLIAPFGLWLDEAQIPDPFVMTPGQFQRSLWHDPQSAAAQDAAAGLANGRGGITAVVERAGNLSAAGKFLWPIPDRGLSKRLPLIQAPTLVVLGASDKLIGAAYGAAFVAAIRDARLVTLADAGHFPMVEQPDAFTAAVEPFLA